MAEKPRWEKRLNVLFLSRSVLVRDFYFALMVKYDYRGYKMIMVVKEGCGDGFQFD
jgi:hypothetical protein